MNFYRDMEALQASMMDMSEEEVDAAMSQMMGHYMAWLFSGSPEYNIRELSFSTPMGDFTSHWRTRLDNVDESVMQDPGLLLQHLEAEADIAASEQLVRAMVGFFLRGAIKKQMENDPNAPVLSDEQVNSFVDQQAAAQLQGLTAQKFLVKESDTYKAQAAFRQGELTLNGQQIPLFGQPFSMGDDVQH